MLSDRVAHLTASETLALNAKVKALAASGRSIYNLTAGEPDAMTPDYIQRAVAKRLKENKYTPAAGLAELRQAIAGNAVVFYGVDWIEADNVVVTAGAKPALLTTFQCLIDPGDEVIVPSPYWLSYRHFIETAGGKMVNVPLKDDFDIDAGQIAKKITSKTKAILLNSPHNPTGAVFSKKQLQKLREILRGKNIWLIADDIYAKLAYTQNFEPVSKVFKGYEKLVIINGFSKSQALTGWRIGYLIARQPLARSAADYASHLLGNAPLLSQLGALEALRRDDRPPMLQDLSRRRRLVIKSLKKIKSLNFVEPQGAFYFLIDIRKINKDSIRWCDQLLDETGVALVPGDSFGAPGFVRLSFAASDDTLKVALSKIKQFTEV